MEKAVNFARAHRWHKQLWLRRIALGILGRFAQHDMTIDHHWVPGRKIRLHRFRHKGYWYHGRRREESTMEGFARLIRPGDTVIELGGHIGYISLYLAHLAGSGGRVFVFEPSPENLPYIESNVAPVPTIELVRKAASDRSGRLRFFIEGLTGQNSTLVENYATFDVTRDRAFSSEHYRTIEVDATTLDAFLDERAIKPDFIKIDIEGAELLALQGMRECLVRHRPGLMVEVTHQEEAVMRLMADAGYVVCDSSMEPLAPNKEAAQRASPNFFFLPKEAIAARTAPLQVRAA
jgi:FkbM family methyltransferase